MSQEVVTQHIEDRRNNEPFNVSTMGVVMVGAYLSEKGTSVLLLSHKENKAKGIEEGMLGLPSETSKFAGNRKGRKMTEHPFATLNRLVESELKTDVRGILRYSDNWYRQMRVNRSVPLLQDTDPANRNTLMHVFTFWFEEKPVFPESPETNNGQFYLLDSVLSQSGLAFRTFPDTPGLLTLLDQEGAFIPPKNMRPLQGIESYQPLPDEFPDFHNI